MRSHGHDAHDGHTLLVILRLKPGKGAAGQATPACAGWPEATACPRDGSHGEHDRSQWHHERAVLRRPIAAAPAVTPRPGPDSRPLPFNRQTQPGGVPRLATCSLAGSGAWSCSGGGAEVSLCERLKSSSPAGRAPSPATLEVATAGGPREQAPGRRAARGGLDAVGIAALDGGIAEMRRIGFSALGAVGDSRRSRGSSRASRSSPASARTGAGC